MGGGGHWKRLIIEKKKKKKGGVGGHFKRIVTNHQLTTFPSGTFSWNHTYEDAYFVKTGELMRGVSESLYLWKTIKTTFLLVIMQFSMRNYHELLDDPDFFRWVEYSSCKAWPPRRNHLWKRK